MEKIYENPNNIILRHILSNSIISKDNYPISFYVDVLEEKIIDIIDTYKTISLRYKMDIDFLKEDLDEVVFNACMLESADVSNVTKNNKKYFLEKSLNQEILYPRNKILVYEYLIKLIDNGKVEVISNFVGTNLTSRKLPKNIQVNPIDTSLISNINTNLNYNIF